METGEKQCIVIKFEDGVRKLKEKRDREIMKMVLEKYYALSDHLDDGYRPPDTTPVS
jgi:hypothetical protein